MDGVDLSFGLRLHMHQIVLSQVRAEVLLVFFLMILILQIFTFQFATALSNTTYGDIDMIGSELCT